MRIIDRQVKRRAATAIGLILICAASAAAQEVGGSLGGSTNVFRPKAASGAASTRPKSGSTGNKAKSSQKNRLSAADKSAKTASAAKNNKRARPERAAVSAVAARREAQFESLIEAGNSARDARQFDAAERSYQQAGKVKPRDARAVYGLGNIYVDQQRWSDAEKFYRQAIALDRGNVEAHVALSYVLLQPNRSGSLESNFAEAERAARRAVALDKNSPMAHDQLGVVLEAKGNIASEAENAYKRAVELDPTYAVAYAHLSRIQRRNGRAVEAAANQTRAISLAKDVPTIILVAEVLQSEGLYVESEDLLRRATAQDATNPTALFLLGRALYFKKSLIEAEFSLQQSVRISPNSFLARSALGAVYLRQGRYSDAERTFLTALEYAAPAERVQLAGANGLAGAGDGFFNTRQYADALRAYRKAFELNSKNAELPARITAAEAGLK